MKYDFNSIETLVLVRSTLRKLVKKIAHFHCVLVSQTNVKDLNSKLKEFDLLIHEYLETEEYALLQEYLNHIHCPNFFRHIDKHFLESLNQESYTLQDVLSILKKISSTSSELEQEIININEKYFF